MAKYTSNYIITAFLTISAACVGSFITQKQPQVVFDARLEAFPMKIGNWQGQDVGLDAGTRKALSGDSIVYRYYTNSMTKRQVCLLIVYRKYGRRGFTHRPEMCYPAAGWEIISKGYTHMPYDGHDVPARCVEAEKGGSWAIISYWFTSGRRTEANYVRQQAKMALDRLQRQKYGWAFIKVDVLEPRGSKDALDLTRAFMKDIGKPLTQTLTGK